MGLTNVVAMEALALAALELAAVVVEALEADDAVEEAGAVHGVDHLEVSAQVSLRKVIQHACVHQTLHEGRPILRQSQPWQPHVPYPLVVHVTES